MVDELVGLYEEATRLLIRRNNVGHTRVELDLFLSVLWLFTWRSGIGLISLSLDVCETW